MEAENLKRNVDVKTYNRLDEVEKKIGINTGAHSQELAILAKI